MYSIGHLLLASVLLNRCSACTGTTIKTLMIYLPWNSTMTMCICKWRCTILQAGPYVENTKFARKIVKISYYWYNMNPCKPHVAFLLSYNKNINYYLIIFKHWQEWKVLTYSNVLLFCIYSVADVTVKGMQLHRIKGGNLLQSWTCYIPQTWPWVIPAW